MPPFPLRTSQTCCHSSSAASRYADTFDYSVKIEHRWAWILVTRIHLKLCVSQDCLRACQEQIESLLESSLQQARHPGSTTEPKRASADADLACTPTDVRDINIWNSWQQQQIGGKVVTWCKSQHCRCQCAPRWKRHVLQGCPREKQGQLMTRAAIFARIFSYYFNLGILKYTQTQITKENIPDCCLRYEHTSCV